MICAADMLQETIIMFGTAPIARDVDSSVRELCRQLPLPEPALGDGPEEIQERNKKWWDETR
jgi:hypothetical protein